jgi:hypothetical protein
MSPGFGEAGLDASFATSAIARLPSLHRIFSTFGKLDGRSASWNGQNVGANLVDLRLESFRERF